MTRSNRALNRLVLALTGLVLIALGALAAVRASNRAWFHDTLASVAPWATELRAWATDTRVLWIAVGAAALLIFIALALVLTLGGGRERDVLTDASGTSIRAGAVRSLIERDLERDPDVIGVGVTGYDVRRGGRVGYVRVDVRPRADLVRVLRSIHSAVDDTRTTIGAPLPLVVHVAAGARSSLHGERNAH